MLGIPLSHEIYHIHCIAGTDSQTAPRQHMPTCLCASVAVKMQHTLFSILYLWWDIGGGLKKNSQWILDCAHRRSNKGEEAKGSKIVKVTIDMPALSRLALILVALTCVTVKQSC